MRPEVQLRLLFQVSVVPELVPVPPGCFPCTPSTYVC